MVDFKHLLEEIESVVDAADSGAVATHEVLQRLAKVVHAMIAGQPEPPAFPAVIVPATEPPAPVPVAVDKAEESETTTQNASAD